MKERILTIDQIVEEGLVPLSKSSLYRVASEGSAESPFRKRSGRWLTTESDLIAWVRNGAKGTRPHRDPNPMPKSKRIHQKLTQEAERLRRIA